jgi:hypothetical protein
MGPIDDFPKRGDAYQNQQKVLALLLRCGLMSVADDIFQCAAAASIYRSTVRRTRLLNLMFEVYRALRLLPVKLRGLS